MMAEDLRFTPPLANDQPALVVVAGRPGAGKGTQCAQIVADLRVAHFSLGDALRDGVAHCTPLGLEVQTYLEAGRSVPDRFVLELIDARFARGRAPLVLLDGFPRTLAQAEALERARPGAVDSPFSWQRLSQLSRNVFGLEAAPMTTSMPYENV